MTATPFELVGGADRIRALVERFYDVMGEREPALAKLHVCTADGRVDRGSRDRFALFLIGWLGGPDDNVRDHGHPRLRMRHMNFAIGDPERDAWFGHMADAVRAGGLDAADELEMLTYFANAAAHLVNHP